MLMISYTYSYQKAVPDLWVARCDHGPRAPQFGGHHEGTQYLGFYILCIWRFIVDEVVMKKLFLITEIIL